jgi:peptidoglycan/xylan/chitin deacetylase (PgdA/CDA1 family)
MRHLRETAIVLPLKELVEQLVAGDVPPGAVAVTFDDGFANFESLAMPILEEFELPATVYLITSFIERENEFEGLVWPDYVHGLLLSTDATSIDLGEKAIPTLDLSSERARHRAKSQVCSVLKKLPNERRLEWIRMLANQANTKLSPEVHALFQGMTWDQVRAIDRKRLVDFGAHTVTHPILSRCSVAVMRQEILESKRVLEERLGRTIQSFAYPNGEPEDYNEEVVEVVRAAFDSAVTTVQGMVPPQCHRYELSRLGIGSDMFFSKFKLFVAGITER